MVMKRVGNTEPFRRVNYHSGQILSEKDLVDEQEYHRGKRKLHNRMLHGCGVVCGLDVTADGESILVDAGLALDCTGNEILLPRAVEMPLPKADVDQYLVIGYEEREIDPTLAPGQEAPMPTRVEEGYSIDYRSEDPRAEHRPAGCAHACGVLHPLPLAIVKRRRKGWSVRRISYRRIPWWVRLFPNFRADRIRR